MKIKPFYFALLAISLLLHCQNSSAQENNYSYTPFEIKEIDGLNTLVIKADVPINSIGEKMGECYGRLFEYVGKKNIVPAGPVFAVYYSWEPGGNVVFEAGIPVAAGTEGSEDITCKEFPAMKALTTFYTGAYEDIEPVYNSAQKYIEDNKLETTGCSWEVYLTDPQKVKEAKQNKTLIYFPLK